MDQELIDMGPEMWSIPDLDGPSDDCPMPDPIRPPRSSGVWFTCPHCTITFILAQQTDGKGGYMERWVNSYQHSQMNRVIEQIEEERHW